MQIHNQQQSSKYNTNLQKKVDRSRNKSQKAVNVKGNVAKNDIDKGKHFNNE